MCACVCVCARVCVRVSKHVCARAHVFLINVLECMSACIIHVVWVFTWCTYELNSSESLSFSSCVYGLTEMTCVVDL